MAGRSADSHHTRRVLLGVSVTLVLAGCATSGHLTPSGRPSMHAPGASAVPSASPQAAATTEPAIVAVTGAGALDTLNPMTGAVEQTLVPSGVLGDEVSVAPNGMIYFAAYYHCTDSIEAIPMSGGTPAIIATGIAPAISPDGTKLAYAVVNACGPPVGILQIRTLSTGATISLPDSPSGVGDGLFPSISHLSWASDNRHLAVSIPQIQDNEGWALNIVDTAQAQYYASGAGVTTVPVTGDPNAQASYFEEGVYLPDGELFVSRACCAGVPVQNTSRLMWEVTTGGAFVHQVAIGYANLPHYSLDASSDGQWLLYLAGPLANSTTPTTLYVSKGGATPRELTTGLIAAAWG